MKFPRLAIFAVALGLGTAGAFAQDAVRASVSPAADRSQAFLAAFAGDWRGSGDAKAAPNSAATRVTCRLTAVYDAGKAALSNSGRCGTTQGSREVSGVLSAAGGALKGQFISGVDTSKLLKQRMNLGNDALVVEAEMENPQGGKIHRLRTVLTKPQGGSFVVRNQFYDWDKAAWITGGEIAFRKQ